jgi:octaprenyl-diphosphate synthase
MSTLTLPLPPRESADPYAPIAADLEATERILRDSLSNSRPGVAELMGYLGNYRGKRLRPALLLLTARACGQVNASHHLLAAVVEMIHTATLVHDDVLDDAVIRRHAPTINASWGNQASILLGDYLFTHAFHLTSTLGQARACQIIGESTNRLCAGELHQVCQRGNLELSEEDYFDIIDGKTAELTSCCCRLGALYSGVAEDVVERLARYGRYLGLAFQIADDLLDLVGEERAVGKSLGTDLEQRKLTLPLIRLLQQAPAEEGGMLRQLLTRPGNHKREILVPRLEAAGALVYARGRAEQFAEQAEKELSCLPASPCKTILQRITRQVVHRSS